MAKSSILLRHSTIYAAGTILRQLTSFLMLPLYTRFLSPSDYGVVGLLTFSLALMEPLFGARLGESISKFYLETDDTVVRRRVLSAALTVTSVASGIAAIGIYAVREPASNLLFGSSAYGMAVGLFGIQILTQAIEAYGLIFIRLKQRPILFIAVNLSKLVLQVGLNVWLIVSLELGVLGVIISGTISSALYALALAGYILYKSGFAFDWATAKRMLQFSWPLWFSGIAGLFIWQSNRIFMDAFGTLDELGLYELAAKFATILTFLAWAPFTQVWDVERFTIYRMPGAAQTFSTTFRVVSVFLIAVALGISIFATPTIHIMSSVEYHGAAGDVPLLVFASLAYCLAQFQNFSFLVSSNTKSISRNNYVTVLVITVLNILLIPAWGDMGAALALMLAMTFLFFLTKATATKLFDMNIRMIDLAGPLAVSVGGYFLANHVLASRVVWIDIVTKALLYLGCVALLFRFLWKDAATRPLLLDLLARMREKLGRS